MPSPALRAGRHAKKTILKKREKDTREIESEKNFNNTKGGESRRDGILVERHNLKKERAPLGATY